MRIFFSRYSLEYLQEADSFRKKKQKTHGLCLWATPICTTRVQIRTCTSRTPPEPHTNRGSQAGPAPFVLDVVGDHTHTHSPRTQSTRQYKPCPLETAAARVEGARYCCVLAAAGPIACGVCLHLEKATRSLTFANHTEQQHRRLIGAVLSEAPSYLENRTWDNTSRRT